MSERKYKYIADLLEYKAPMEGVIEEALYALGLGGQVCVFISELVYFAKDHDLEERRRPLAILEDAFHEVEALYPRR